MHNTNGKLSWLSDYPINLISILEFIKRSKYVSSEGAAWLPQDIGAHWKFEDVRKCPGREEPSIKLKPTHSVIFLLSHKISSFLFVKFSAIILKIYFNF